MEASNTKSTLLLRDQVRTGIKRPRGPRELDSLSTKIARLPMYNNLPWLWARNLARPSSELVEALVAPRPTWIWWARGMAKSLRRRAKSSSSFASNKRDLNTSWRSYIRWATRSSDSRRRTRGQRRAFKEWNLSSTRKKSEACETSIMRCSSRISDAIFVKTTQISPGATVIENILEELTTSKTQM